MVRVLVHVGVDVVDRIHEDVPEAEVVQIPTSGELEPGLEGEVLLTTTYEVDNLEHVLTRGVRWVHAFGTGVERFPFDKLEGTVLTCSRGASGVPIAEFVLACMLAHEKQLPDVWIDAPPQRWARARLGTLRDRELGLVGIGGIGSEVARLALAFGMRVRATRRSDAPSPVDGVELVGELEELLPSADHLVLTAPATDETRHLLDDETLGAVKPGVHVVNIARGDLIDQDALLRAIDDGRVGAASLDVCDPEPLPAGHPLYTHPKVRLSPHISWSAPGALDVILDRFVENLRRYVDGAPLDGVVDTAAGY